MMKKKKKMDGLPRWRREKKTKNTCRDNKEGHRPHHCNQAKTLVDET
jgi:hypothetical protein